MTSRLIAVLVVCLVSSHAAGQVVGQPVPVAPEPMEPPVVLKEFPKEFSHGGTRIYDLKFEPQLGSLISPATRIVVKFKYETDQAGKTFVGGMPLEKGAPVGGYQPAQLNQEKGEAEFGMFCGGFHGKMPAAETAIDSPEALRATYQTVDGLEFMLYGGGAPKQPKWHVPLDYTVIPAAMFTVREKYYLDRLLKEFVSLKRRVDELEAKAK